MTERKVAKLEDARFASAIKKYLISTEELGDVVSDEMIRPKEGEITTAYSGEFMQKVALSIDSETARAQREDRDPDLMKALSLAECPPEMYLQMADHPDYRDICRRISDSLNLLPRWAMICRSMSQAAMHGDVSAARWVAERIKEGDSGIDEVMRQLEREGEGALSRMAAELNIELHELVAQSERKEAPMDLIEAAQADVAVQHMASDDVKRIDYLKAYADGDIDS